MSQDRIFRVDFYPQEWLTDTGALTAEECGLFIQIVSLIYAKRGAIDNDPSFISRKLQDCSTRKATTIISSLHQKGFIIVSEGKIGQKRAENELNKKRTHLEHSSNGGRTSAENRRESIKNNDIVSSEHELPLGTSSLSPIASPNTPISPSGKKGAKPKFILPEKIPSELWEAFESMREKKKRPMTDAARSLNVNKLLKLEEEGHDIRRVMEETIARGWDSFYPLKEDQFKPPQQSKHGKGALTV